MQVINMTPHDITVKIDDNEKIYKASGKTIRLEFVSEVAGEIDGFPINKQVLIGHNFPGVTPNTLYLVSAIALTEAKKMGRTDFVAPDTSNAERNTQGHIISVPGFVQ